MKAIEFETKDFGNLKVLVQKTIVSSDGKTSVRSWNVHKAMVWNIIKKQSKKYGTPSNIQCGFEDDKGVIQYYVCCDFPKHWMHLRQDFYDLINNDMKLKMFVNCHISNPS